MYRSFAALLPTSVHAALRVPTTFTRQQIFFCLRPLHVGVGGGVHHSVQFVMFEGGTDGIGLRDVEFGAGREVGFGSQPLKLGPHFAA